MLIPIGLDQQTVRRLPWVSITIIAANFVIFATVGTSFKQAEERIAERRTEADIFWARHPYLTFPEKLQRLESSPAPREKIKLMIEVVKSPTMGRPTDPDQVEREQRELDRMAEEVEEALADHPILRWGLVPAHPAPMAFLTSMFMHSGWLHLLGNLLFFYLSGPFIEDVFGRPLFAALYLGSGVVAAFAHIGAFPHAETPLVGASGAIAGIMGAFLFRFARTKIRFFYFYWVFMVFRGTFDAPAWVVLPLWLVQQLFFAGLASGTGVAYWAHVGGFVFGFLAAVAIKQFRIEEKYVAPKIEKEISVTQHPALDQGMDLMAQGRPAAAREAFKQVLAVEPRNADAHLGIWQSYIEEGNAAAGAEDMVRAVDDEVRRGETLLALDHWRELVRAAGVGGPPALRYRLAALLEPLDSGAAAEVLRHLAADPGAELLADKAARRLAAFGAGAGPVAAVAAAPPLIPLAAGRAPATPPLAPALALVRDEEQAGAPQAVPTEVGRIEVEACNLERVMDDGLLLRDAIGIVDLLPFPEIEAVTVAGITSSPRPYLVLDLGLRGKATGPRRVVRLQSSELDPRQMTGRSDLSPLDAFREVVRRIADAAGVLLTPPSVAVVGGKIPTFASIADYERELQSPLR